MYIYRFFRGEWSKNEDLEILYHVLKNGTKWSTLKKSNKIFETRTEHNLKNRFFSILSKYLEMPIRKIKKRIEYSNPTFLNSIIDQINNF